MNMKLLRYFARKHNFLEMREDIYIQENKNSSTLSFSSNGFKLCLTRSLTGK